MIIATLDRQADDDDAVGFDFSLWPAFVASPITAATAAVVAQQPATAAALAVTAAVTATANVVSVRRTGGADGARYTVRLTVRNAATPPVVIARDFHDLTDG